MERSENEIEKSYDKQSNNNNSIYRILLIEDKKSYNKSYITQTFQPYITIFLEVFLVYSVYG